MKKALTITFVMLLVAMLTTSGAWSQDFMSASQGYGVGAWYTSVFGEMTDTVGGRASLRGDLGIRHGWGVNADADWQFSDKWGGNLNFAHISSRSNNFVTPGFTYGGVTVFNGTQLNTRTNMSTAHFMLRYNLARTQDGILDVAVVPQWVNFDTLTTRSVDGVTVINESRARLIPCIGFSGKQRISERLYFYGDIHGMGYRNNHVLDLRGDLRWNFQTPGWQLTVGYRLLDIRADLAAGAARRAKANWNGPLATIRYEF